MHHKKTEYCKLWPEQKSKKLNQTAPKKQKNTKNSNSVFYVTLITQTPSERQKEEEESQNVHLSIPFIEYDLVLGR